MQKKTTKNQMEKMQKEVNLYVTEEGQEDEEKADPV